MTTLPESFKLLDVPLPPMLLQMAGVKGDSRFVSLFYAGSKATWSDGRGCATFPLFTVWQPYTQHLALAIHLFDYHLGSDDSEPTHTLVCDRQQQKVYIARWGEAERFLDSQHPPQQPMTTQEWGQIKAQLAQHPPLDISQLQDLGMLELFMPPKPEHKERAVQLIQWLDQYIDQAVIRKCVEAAQAGDYRAVWALETFRRRCQQHQE